MIILLMGSKFLAGDPTSTLLTFLLAVNAYKKEFHELMLQQDHHETIEERYGQLLHDATTICAKFVYLFTSYDRRYLSPASDDFMGLTLEQYRDVLDSACSEKEPRINCFDDLYKLIFKTVEKKLLHAFLPPTDIKTRYVRKNAPSKDQSKHHLAPIQLNVLALSDVSLTNRLPRVYTNEPALSDEQVKFMGKKMYRLPFLFKKGEFLAAKDENIDEGKFTHVSSGKILSAVAGRVKVVKDGSHISSITRRFARCEIIAIDNRVLAGPFRGMIKREDIRETQKDRAEPSLSFRPGDLVRAKVVNIIGSSSGSYISSCLPAAEECSPVVGTIVAAARTVAGAVKPSPAHAVCGSSSATTTYLLSTAQPELGVVVGFGRPSLSGLTEVLGATSGCPLLPASWTEMVCPRTLTRFPRKVARVPDELTDILCSSAMQGIGTSE
nr:exosome complex component CSL4 [Hymenolepis microstoma]